ncbi:MAG: CoA transferase, partial [Pseudomonadales bacterium]|nr:CoA transferase [Pseudomonadales bacterium]
MTIKTANKTPTVSLDSLPLARSANQALNKFKDLAGETEELANLSGATLLYERALMLGLAPQPRFSPNGSCRLMHCKNAVIAMNLPRPSDWELLPALLCPFLADDIAPIEIAEGDWDTLDTYCQPLVACDLLEQAHCLGIAASMASELPPAPAQKVQRQCFRQQPAEKPPVPPTQQQPLVIDLSSLWAGPLCSYLLQQAGCRVIKVESKQRLDGARLGSPAFYQLLNQGKESVALDFDSSDDIAQLKQLIAQADIVIEASRPRALRQLGIEAEQLVKTTPGLVWLSITGHGRSGADGERIGFGDDAAAAAGLSQIAFEASGEYHLIGDAIADPLTGIHAALAGLKSYRTGGNELISLSLRDTVAACLHWELAHSRDAVLAACRNWMNKFPLLAQQKSKAIRTPTHACAAPGEHNAIVLKQPQKTDTQKKNLFIKNAEVYQVGINDLRIENGLIKEMGNLTPQPNETVIDAHGGALLPGLNDHHIHFLSYAASLASVDCSPNKVIDRKGLINALQQNAGTIEWLRGFGYHESIAGDIDCHWLDQYGPNRPV